MDSEVWKQFDQNPVTHSAAHHLVAIAELREQRGYARVSDVARYLNITRGSASLTLKALKQRGLVEEDENRFLRLSAEGQSIANMVRGKKFLIRKFFTEVLGVPGEAAEVDTCKIEHLVSNETAERLAQFLRFVESGDSRVRAFWQAWSSYDEACGHDPSECPSCYQECLMEICHESEDEER